MTKTYTPERAFAQFGKDVRDFESSDDILDILTELSANLNQNMGAYIGGPFISLWLGEGEKDEKASADLDLLFVNQDDGYIDVIFRQRTGLPVSGGTLMPSKTLKLTDEIIEGYRVIIGVAEDGTEVRHEVVAGRYSPVIPFPFSLSASRARRRQL